MRYIILFFVTVFVLSCDSNNKNNTEKWKNEILQTEAEFSKMAVDKSVKDAFIAFAAEDAVLLRNNELLIGKNALIEHYSKHSNGNDNAKLTWTPEFVDVSKSGDIGYTYGYYEFEIMDSIGKEIITRGVFHTIWKRQPDGEWKFVWD